MITNGVEFSKEWTELGQINPSKVAALARRPKKITIKPMIQKQGKKECCAKAFGALKLKTFGLGPTNQ